MAITFCVWDCVDYVVNLTILVSVLPQQQQQNSF